MDFVRKRYASSQLLPRLGDMLKIQYAYSEMYSTVTLGLSLLDIFNTQPSQQSRKTIKAGVSTHC